MKKVLSVVLALAMLLGICTSAFAEGIRHENLVVALSAEPANLNTYESSHNTTSLVCRTIFESLLKSKDGVLSPWLATSYTVVDDTTIQFALRDDVVFHNGAKMTAEDVLFSLCYGAKSSFTSTLFGCIDTENSKVIDEHTVEFKLQYPYAPFLEAVASYRGAIIPKAAFEEMGADAFGRAPIGTGPMMFKQWVNGDRIELTANDKYWADPVNYDNMTYRIILEASTRSIELESGGIDVAFDVSPSDWSRLMDNPETTMLTGNTTGMTYLCFNNSKELYGNETIRKAIAYAIDVEAVAKTAYQGRADAAAGFMVPSIHGYKAEGPWEYNPEKSKELLKEAGYGEGELTVEFVTFQQQFYNACIEIIQSMLSEVGIKCTIEMVDLATFTSMNNGGELPMTVMANSATILDPSSALVAWPLTRTISLRHNDQHIQDLLDAGVQTYDMDERVAIYGELQDYLYEKLYILPLAFPMGGYACRAYIENFDYTPTTIPDFTTITFAK